MLFDAFGLAGSKFFDGARATLKLTVLTLVP